jgi:hypothetical protein
VSMTDLDPAPSMFAPMSIEEVESRLADIKEYSCDCGDSPHENALHDLAADDVTWLIDRLREAQEREQKILALLAANRAGGVCCKHDSAIMLNSQIMDVLDGAS